MKHRILLLLSCIFFLQGMLNAQDLEPGQQAQGYLDSKSMMVDYATGIFHYKIPPRIVRVTTPPVFSNQL